MSAPIAKIVGTSSGGSWCQVHSFLGSEKYKEHLTVVVSLQDEGEESCAQVGKKILSNLQEDYSQKVQTLSCFSALKESLESVCNKFCKDHIELAVSVLWGKYVYFGVIGEAKVAIKRNGGIALLLSGQPEQVTVISGLGQENDIYVLGTQKFFQRIPTPRLLDYLNKNEELQDFVDQVVSEISIASTPLVASALFKFVPPVKEEVSEKEESFVKRALVGFAHKLPEEEAVVVKNEAKSRRTAVSIGAVLLLLLGASIVFGVKQKKAQDYKLSYEAQLTQAMSVYTDSLSQKDINPPRARELFLEAKNIADNLITQGIKDMRLDQLKVNLDTGSGDVLGRVDAKSSVFRDLSLVRSGIVATKIALDGESMGILDTSMQRIISVSTSTKDTEVLAGSEKIGIADNIAVSGTDYYVFGTKGVVKASKKGGAEIVVKPDSDLGQIAGLGVYRTNLYLLDKSNGIWKYQLGGEGVKQKWLKDEVDVDLGQGVGMAIDGSLWVLLENGDVLKFTRGNKDVFRIAGLDQRLNKPIAIYTDENLDNLYILDNGNGRIVEISKSGEFKKEYKGEGIGEANSLVVSRDARSIFLLTDSKVLEIKL